MDTAQRTPDAALGGLGRGDAAQRRAEDRGAAGGLLGSAAALRGMEDARVTPAMKKSGKCAPGGDPAGGGGEDAGAGGRRGSDSCAA